MLGPSLPRGIPCYRPDLETLSRIEIEDLQERSLQLLAREIYPENPFYRRKWTAAGVRDPREISGLKDLAFLPFTTKVELLADQEEQPPWGTNLTYPLERYTRFHQTSGTSGRPLKWLDTPASWDWWVRCWSYVFRGASVGPGDRIFFAFSFGPFVGFWSAFAAGERLGALCFPGGAMDSRARLKSILDNKVSVLVSTPSYALRLAEVAGELGLNLAESSVVTTIHAGEPGVGVPATRKLIEEAWAARSHDHYGMTEAGALSFTCTVDPNAHLIETENIFEVVDPATGRPVPPGERGELVVTNLGRHGSPVIRYRTGDMVCLDAGPCPCGRTFHRLRGGILGRVDDMITVRGVNVFPSTLENIVRRYPEVDEFRIEVFKARGMDEVRLLLEIDPGRHGQATPERISERVALDIRQDLALRMEVLPVSPGTLPRFELKAKRLVRLDNTGGSVTITRGSQPGPTEVDLERRWKSLVRVCHDFYFAWRKVLLDYLGADRGPEATRRFYDLVGRNTARAFREQLNLDGSDVEAVARAMARSSLIMGEEVQVCRRDDDILLIHTSCPWLEAYRRAGAEDGCLVGCDQWFHTTLAALSPALRFHTEESMVKGHGRCVRRIWREDPDGVPGEDPKQEC